MQTRLANAISERIREMILQERLAAGDRLPTESALMRRFGVGRSTIREAMKQLQAENVVEVRHGTGSFVAARPGLARDPLGLTFEEQDRLADDLMEVRLMLEPSAAARAAARRTAEDLAAMGAAIEAMRRAALAGENYTRHDSAFHIAIAQATGNRVLTRMVPVIFEAVEASYPRTVHVKGSTEAALDYHARILRAIEAGDADGAARRMESHIRQTLEDMKNRQRGETT